ncbi:MAG TPA: VOC family protein [Candidatus Acidoferrales bacterium]|nr:VOC family protein [Candidatus Acidoferrales bacterium]
MAIQGARPAHGQLAPNLLVRNTMAAIDFYQRAFGAEVLYCAPLPNGENRHAKLRIANSVFSVTQEDSDPKHQMERSPGRLASPETLGGTTAILEIYVDDPDAMFRRAVDAGATPTCPITDSFWGDRYGWVTDPFGYIWALAEVKEELTPEQVKQRMDDLFASMGH